MVSVGSGLCFRVSWLGLVMLWGLVGGVCGCSDVFFV